MATDALRPVLPGPSSRIPAPIAMLPTEATVTARVTTCPAQAGSPPPSVEVSFLVVPPEQGTLEAGGHAPGHIDPRPLQAWGSFERAGGPKVSSCTVTSFDAEGMGSCTVTYHSSEVSGKETIKAEAAGFPNAETKVTVQIPGLIPMPASAIGTWRLTGEEPSHPRSHYGTPQTLTRIGAMATDYFAPPWRKHRSQ